MRKLVAACGQCAWKICQSLSAPWAFDMIGVLGDGANAQVLPGCLKVRERVVHCESFLGTGQNSTGPLSLYWTCLGPQLVRPLRCCWSSQSCHPPILPPSPFLLHGHPAGNSHQQCIPCCQSESLNGLDAVVYAPRRIWKRMLGGLHFISEYAV